MHAVGVNPIDYHTAMGRGYMDAVALPHIPGWDIAGVVEEVGFGTNRFAPGDAVFGFPRFPRAAGGFAEYVTAPSRQLAVKPAALILVHGGPVAQPADAAFVLQNTKHIHGFYGASSMERLPVETALTDQTRAFKAIGRRGGEG